MSYLTLNQVLFRVASMTFETLADPHCGSFSNGPPYWPKRLQCGPLCQNFSQNVATRVSEDFSPSRATRTEHPMKTELLVFASITQSNQK